MLRVEDGREAPEKDINCEASTAVEFYLTSSNIEAAINDHLLSNGILIYPKTRIFLANIRDVIGALARRAKDAT